MREVEARLDGPVEHLATRLALLEQSVFGRKGPSNRFEIMESDIS